MRKIIKTYKGDKVKSNNLEEPFLPEGGDD